MSWCLFCGRCCRLSDVLDNPLHTATFYFLLQLGGYLAAQEGEAHCQIQQLQKKQQQQEDQEQRVKSKEEQLLQEQLQVLRAFPGNQPMRWLARSARSRKRALDEVNAYVGSQVRLWLLLQFHTRASSVTRKLFYSCSA
jgi:hypothetical protein